MVGHEPTLVYHCACVCVFSYIPIHRPISISCPTPHPVPNTPCPTSRAQRPHCADLSWVVGVPLVHATGYSAFRSWRKGYRLYQAENKTKADRKAKQAGAAPSQVVPSAGVAECAESSSGVALALGVQQKEAEVTLDVEKAAPHGNDAVLRTELSRREPESTSIRLDRVDSTCVRMWRSNQV